MNADAQVEARVREHLQPGENFRAAVWASRADERPPVEVTHAAMSLFRFRFRRIQPDRSRRRRSVQRSPQSLAAGLNEHMRIVTDPRILALTDRRLLVLSKRLGPWRAALRPTSAPLAPLRPLWECPRKDLASSSEQAGRLRLDFTDGSTATLLTPSAAVQPFLAG